MKTTATSLFASALVMSLVTAACGSDSSPTPKKSSSADDTCMGESCPSNYTSCVCAGSCANCMDPANEGQEVDVMPTVENCNKAYANDWQQKICLFNYGCSYAVGTTCLPQ